MAQWLGIRLQMLGVAMVAGVAFIAVLEHHFNTVDPGTELKGRGVEPCSLIILPCNTAIQHAFSIQNTDCII